MKRVLHILLLVLSLSSCIKEKQKGADLGVGDIIPDFTIAMNDGTQVTGALLREGVSVIVFFTTQCGDCRETLPHIQQLYDEYARKGVRFVLVSREDTEANISSFWKESGFTMPFSAVHSRDTSQNTKPRKAEIMPINRELEKVSAHLASRLLRLDMPPSSFLPMTGTSQIPTIIEIVITSKIFRYCCAVNAASEPRERPMADRALLAAMVS